MLPPRKPKVRSGIERAPQREFPKHRAFVRRHACCVPGCDQGPIEFAHVRTAANSGVGLKPGDEHGVSLCPEHHSEQHQQGLKTFEGKYKVNLQTLAREFALNSPVPEVREYVRGMEQ